MRLGDSGRETAVGVLKRAFTNGQLTKDEFEASVEAAYQALSATTCAHCSRTSPSTRSCGPTLA